MELRQLRYFLALAEELNFTHAAARLNISQPPLSVQISQLENEIGVKLFQRTSRKVELTEAGRVFQQRILDTFGHLSDAISRAQAVERGLAGHIDIGLSGSHFQGPLPERIRSHAQRFPDIAIVLHEMQPATQLETLRRGRLDVSISRASVNDDTLFSTLLWRDPVVVAMPAGATALQRHGLSLADLRHERFVLLKPESSVFAEQIHAACHAAGYMPSIAQQVVEIPAQLRLVAAGLGIALVPASTIPYSAGVATAQLTDPPPPGDVYAVRRRHHATGLLDNFVAHLSGEPGSQQAAGTV